MLLCVITNQKKMRALWRNNIIQQLSEVGIDTMFFDASSVSKFRDEQTTNNDIVHIPIPSFKEKLHGFQLRSIAAIEWALNNTSYDWLVRADDDTFFCPDAMRQALNVLPLHTPIHWAHYQLGGRGILVSDANAVYNRLGAALWLSIIKNSNQSDYYGYMDIADKDPSMTVIPDVRLAYGLDIERARKPWLADKLGPIDPELNWGKGVIYLPPSPAEIDCVCEDMLAIHIRTKNRNLFARLAETSSQKTKERKQNKHKL